MGFQQRISAEEWERVVAAVLQKQRASAMNSWGVCPIASAGFPAVLKYSQEPYRRAALQQERRVLHHLAGTGVVPAVLAADSDPEPSWLVLESIAGYPPVVPLDPESPVVNALQAALRLVHAQSIVHCDLKPSNILVQDSRVMLLDWGLAAATGVLIEDLPRRPYSPGWTHPDLIWGRGYIREALDWYSVSRICGQAAAGSAVIVPDNLPAEGYPEELTSA